MATYFLRVHPGDSSPFGHSQVMPFSADTLTHAQAEAQSMASLFGVKLILEDPNTSVAAGVARSVFTPAVVSTVNVNLTSGISHK